MSTQRCLLTVIILLTIILLPTARADTRVDLTPSVAFFVPTTKAIDEAGATAEFAGATGFGGRLGIWLSENVALEATGHYVKSSLDGQYLGQELGSIGTGLFYGSAQVAVGLGASRQFMIHGGIGVQGSNYDELIEGGNIMTGVLGLSVWVPLGDTVALRGDLDTHIHTQYYELGDQRTQELNQYDLILSVGLMFSPEGR